MYTDRHDLTNPCKHGFTLAEVLITIGIIGIIAALTLPSIIAKNQRKELQVSLKNAYSILSQALLELNNEQGFPANSKNYPTQTFVKAYIKKFKVYKDCGFYGCVDVTKYKTYNKLKTLTSAYFDDGRFIISNGMVIFIENYELSNIGILISVDINGPKKGPNIWGYDLFTFQVTDNGTLLPMGAPNTLYNSDTYYCSLTSNLEYNGIGCTQKALTKDDYWKNLP